MYNRREQSARTINHTQIRSTEFIDILSRRSNIGDVRPVFKRFMPERNTESRSIEEQSIVVNNAIETALKNQIIHMPKLLKVTSIAQNVEKYSSNIKVDNRGAYLIVYIDIRICFIVILWRLNRIYLQIYFYIRKPHHNKPKVFYKPVKNGRIYFRAIKILLKLIYKVFDKKKFNFIHLNMFKTVHCVLFLIFVQASMSKINSGLHLKAYQDNMTCIFDNKKHVLQCYNQPDFSLTMQYDLLKSTKINIDRNLKICNNLNGANCVMVQKDRTIICRATKLMLINNRFLTEGFVYYINQNICNIKNANVCCFSVQIIHNPSFFECNNIIEVNNVNYSSKHDSASKNDQNINGFCKMSENINIYISKHTIGGFYDVNLSFQSKSLIFKKLCKSEILHFFSSLKKFLIRDILTNYNKMPLKNFEALARYYAVQITKNIDQKFMPCYSIQNQAHVKILNFRKIYKDSTRSLMVLKPTNMQKERTVKNTVCGGDKIIKLDFVVYRKESIIVNLQYVERIKRLIDFKKYLLPLKSVAYANLSEPLRKDFAIYCCKRIKKMNGGGFFKRLWRKVNYALMPKTEDYYQEPKKIGKSIYDLAEYCAHLAPRMMALFRKMNETEIIQKFAKYIQHDIEFDFDYLLVYHSSAVFIEFFRMCLDGLVPSCLATTILYFREKDILFDLSNEKTRLFWKLLPFTISGEKRKLLKILLEMWEEMEYAHEICHYQPLEIAEMFCPAILPKRLLKKIGDSVDRIKFVDAMFHLNYDLVDTDVYLDYAEIN
ncbi:hypothetical protein COBT_001494 [Conglomerata obtusa]